MTVPCPTSVPNRGAIPVVNYISLQQSDYTEETKQFLLNQDHEYLVNQGFTTKPSPMLANLGMAECNTADRNCEFPPLRPDSPSNVTHSSLAVCSLCTEIKTFKVKPEKIALPVDSLEELPSVELPNGLMVGGNLTRLDRSQADMGERALRWLTWLDIATTYDPNTWPLNESSSDFTHIASVAGATTFLSLFHSEDAGENQTYLYANGTSKIGVLATKCTLYPCVQDYYGYIQEGNLREELDKAWPLQDISPISESNRLPKEVPTRPGANSKNTAPKRNDTARVSSPEDSRFGNVSLFGSHPGCNFTQVQTRKFVGDTSLPEDCVYFMDGSYVNALKWYLDGHLNGRCSRSTPGDDTLGAGSTPICDDSARGQNTSIIGNQLSSRSNSAPSLQAFMTSNFNTSHDDIKRIMSNVALAATTAIRQFGFNASNAGGFQRDGENRDAIFVENISYPQPGLVHGMGKESTVCYQIVYPWMLFSLALNIIVLALVSWAIVDSYRRRQAGLPVWKSSVLPLLFHGMDGNSLEAEYYIQGTKTIEREEMKKSADKTIAKLASRPDGGCGFLVTNRRPFRHRDLDDEDTEDGGSRSSMDTAAWQDDILEMRYGV